MFTPPAAEQSPVSKYILLKIVGVTQWKVNGVTSTICRKILLEMGSSL